MTKRILFLAAVFFTACGEEKVADTTTGSALPVVFAVNAPLADFAQRIGGDFVDVRFPAPTDVDPAFWQPDAETIIAYQGADLILMNGANYAKWVANSSLPLANSVDCSHGLESGFIGLEGSTPHTHGPAGEHDHGELAFTLWLDPRRAIRMAANIEQAFSARWPAQSDAFSQNLGELERELESVDQGLAEAFESIAQQPIVFSHPVYQYLEERYKINGLSLHWEPGEAPTEQQWGELDALLAKHAAKLMIWEDKPLDSTTDALKQRGIAVIVFDPGANRSDRGDSIQLMRTNLENLTAH